MFRLSNDEELDIETLSSFISEHRSWVDKRYRPLMDAYMTRYPIFNLPPKPEWKPDKRIAVNFAKYIVDTMNGFFIGIPIKLQCDGDNISKYVEFLDQYNDQDDNNAELSKICSIYGSGYEMYFVDDTGNIGITYLTPMDAFMIYDDSISDSTVQEGSISVKKLHSREDDRYSMLDRMTKELKEQDASALSEDMKEYMVRDRQRRALFDIG